MIPRGLLLLTLLYGGLDCIGGVLGAKLVAVGPLAVEGGMFAFILLVATGSAATELYGAPLGRRLVLMGFLPLVLSMLLIRLVIVLPPAPFWEQQEAFARLLGQSARMMLAGMIAYGISQTLNVTIFAWGRADGGGPLIWLRAMVAGVLSQLVDTVIFISISFWGVAPIGRILPGQALAKVVLSIVLVPPVVYALVALGRRLDATEPP